MPNWLFILRQVRRQLWLTVALYSGLGLAASLLAAVLGRYVPADFPLKLGSDSVDDILSILASSMLAVATFALTTLVTAYTSVGATLSPRAAQLLVGESGVRTPLATFVGAFIYSIVGIVAVHTGYYGAQGRVILFFVTLGVLLLVTIAMLRWIGQLSRLAQSHNVIARVAEAVQTALDAPTTVSLGPGAAPFEVPDRGQAVQSDSVGFVQNIDLSRMQRATADVGAVVYLTALPGAFVRRGQPLLLVDVASLTDSQITSLRSCVTIGPERTFDQDPLFGLQVLGEIASRALSPGVNDPGTAREVVSRTAVMLAEHAPEVQAQRVDDAVRVRPIAWLELIEAAFGPVAREGAGDLQLQLDLHEALGALANRTRPELAQAACAFSETALGGAITHLTLQADRERLVRAAINVSRTGRSPGPPSPPDPAGTRE